MLTGDGKTIVGVEQPITTPEGPTTDIAYFSAATAKRTEVLAAHLSYGSVAWTNSSGTVLIIAANSAGVLHGKKFTPIPGPPPRFTGGSPRVLARHD